MRVHFRRTFYWILIACILTSLVSLKIHIFTSQLIFQQFTDSLLRTNYTAKLFFRTNATSLHSTEVIESQRNESELYWPSKSYYSDDRILNQLKFRPKSVNTSTKSQADIPLKKIYLLTGSRSRIGRHIFLENKCQVNTCEIVYGKNSVRSADALIFHPAPSKMVTRSSPDQIWILFLLESPYHTVGLADFAYQFNWTATYRHDSDIVAPYEKFVRYDENIKFLPQNKSYAEGKTKKVAWFVSNCGARNGRLSYARQLSKYIQVDIYGACGPLNCSRQDDNCFKMLNSDYKFYLSFENSNCRDYITEKFFVNGLQHDVIPIVMGAAPEDYARAAPPHSFIHVDDFESPEQLAQYLHKLDQNDDLYNEYFRWKGTGSFINTYFWCRICGMLHETSRESHAYRDLEKWWRGDGVCIGKDNWRQRNRSLYIVQDYLV